MTHGDTHTCDVFDMLTRRLKALEDSLASAHCKLDRQDLAARHFDSLQDLGTNFSGVRLCGQCVRLCVHNKFDSDGSFCENLGNVIIVLSGRYLTQIIKSMWEEADSRQWKWDDDICKAWGPAKLNLVRANIKQWYLDDPNRESPRPEDIGIEVSHHKSTYTKVHEVALKIRHPGLLSIGYDGVALEHCSMKEAVRLVIAVASDLQCSNMLSDCFDIYCIPSHLLPLAAATMAEEIWDFQTKSKAAWMALSNSTKQRLLAEQGRPGAFFTQQRLFRCL